MSRSREQFWEEFLLDSINTYFTIQTTACAIFPCNGHQIEHSFSAEESKFPCSISSTLKVDSIFQEKRFERSRMESSEEFHFSNSVDSFRNIKFNWDWTHARLDLIHIRSDWTEHWKTWKKTHKIRVSRVF